MECRRSRLGLGPVFAYEWLTTSRRWQLYAMRSGFVTILLLAIGLIWWQQVAGRPAVLSRRALADVGSQFFLALAGTQLALVLLAAPAATAGALCMDKARGCLLHLLMTDLSGPEIVLGKLAARLLPVLGLVLAGMPVLFLGLLLGGIDPQALLSSLLVTLGTALLGCALALVLSVWGTRTHEVLLGTYTVWVLAMLAVPMWWGLSWAWTLGPPPLVLYLINPFWLALASYWCPGTTTLAHAGYFLAATVGLSALLVGTAAVFVRPVTIRQSNSLALQPRTPRRPRRWLPGPSLDANPVLWREWHRRRPSRWARVIWFLYGGLSVAFTVLAVTVVFSQQRTDEMAPLINGLIAAIGLLLLSAGAATALAEERVRGSLDVLLTTPLPTRAIVWGKWWGTFRTVPRLALLPAVIAFAEAWEHGHWLSAGMCVALFFAYGAAITSLGLAMATWIRRFGWAVACVVTAYLLAAVGLPLFGLAISFGQDDLALMIACGSPFYGIAIQTICLEGPTAISDLAPGTFVVWTVLNTAVAAALYTAVLVSFNWCLGRMPEGTQPTRHTLVPPVPPKVVQVEVAGTLGASAG